MNIRATLKHRTHGTGWRTLFRPLNRFAGDICPLGQFLFRPSLLNAPLLDHFPQQQNSFPAIG